MLQWGSDIDDEIPEPKVSWYKRRRLWSVWVPLFLMLGFIGSGILIYQLNPVKVGAFDHSAQSFSVY